MTTTHYSVSASVGVNARALRPTTVVMDIGAGFALIKKSRLPANWRDFEVNFTNLPGLGDANGNALELEAMVHLTIRLGNTLYRVPFLVAERLAVDVIQGTAFMNKHVQHICCRGQVIDLYQGGTIPILAASDIYPERSEGAAPDNASGPGSDPDVDPKAHIYQRGKRRKSSIWQPHAIRLTEHVRIPAISQAVVPVRTGARGLCVLEPKQALQARHQVRIANGVVEVPPAERFRVFLSNFSKSPRRLPKGTVIGYANRNPISIVTPNRDVAEKCGKQLNLTTLPASSSPEFEIENPTWDDSAANFQVGGSLEPVLHTQEETPGRRDSPSPGSAGPSATLQESVNLDHLPDDGLRTKIMAMLAKHRICGTVPSARSTQLNTDYRLSRVPGRTEKCQGGQDRRLGGALPRSSKRCSTQE